MNKFTLYEALQDGYNLIKTKDNSDELAKIGTWRGGTVGCITEAGDFLGADPRNAVLRFHGIQTDTDFDTNLMFQFGRFNEDGWAELLTAADEQYKREEDIPMTRELVVDGTTHKITGRPDIVIMKDGTPHLGIELKQICSFHTAIKVANFADNRPKTDHIIQAAGYSMYFDIPWVLAYTSRVNFPVLYGNPSKANPTGRFQCDHRALKKDDKGRAYSLNPFISMYDLTWDGDTLLVDGEPTLITKSGINRWYHYCATCVQTKTIPTSIGGGIEYDGYAVDDTKNNNLMYFEFKEVPTNSFDEWISGCRALTDTGVDK